MVNTSTELQSTNNECLRGFAGYQVSGWIPCLAFSTIELLRLFILPNIHRIMAWVEFQKEFLLIVTLSYKKSPREGAF